MSEFILPSMQTKEQLQLEAARIAATLPDIERLDALISLQAALAGLDDCPTLYCATLSVWIDTFKEGKDDHYRPTH